MKLAKHPQAKQIAAVSAFFVLVAVAVWLVLISPQRSHAKTLGTEIESVRAQIVERHSALAAANRPVEQIRTADLFRLRKAMPDEMDMPGILLELSRIAQDTGIDFQSITPGAATVLTGYQVVPVDLVFQGNFYDLADFVYRLRNLVVVKGGQLGATGRLFSVDSFQLAEGEDKFPQVQATLTVDAYVYGSGAPVTAPGASPATGTTGTDTTSTTTTSTTTTAPSPTTPPAPPTSASAAGATN